MRREWGCGIGAVAVDRARPFHSHVFRVDGIDQAHISVPQRGIAAERHGVHVVVLLAVGGAQQRSVGRDAQRDVALELDHADDEDACRHQHDSAPIAGAGIDGGLHGRRVERGAVALGAEVADIVDAGA